MISLKNLTKTYVGREVETTALNKVSFDIEQGEFVAIMGPSGCGKSTLLNVLGLLDTPDHGHYYFNGEDIARHSEGRLTDIRKQNIGFIFQNYNLIDEMTVEENIGLALRYHHVPRDERKRRVNQIMDKVGIGHRAQHAPSQLSGGQQQRVAIARAIVGNQRIILADEPTGNLDSQHGQEIMSMLIALNKEGTTIIMVTHSPEHAAYATRTINLHDGKVVIESVKAA